MKWLEHVARLNGETTSVPTLELMMTTSSLADEGDVMRTTAASILEMSGKKVEELLLTSGEFNHHGRVSCGQTPSSGIYSLYNSLT